MRDGFGQMQFANGSRYTGEWVGGVASGVGAMVFADYSTYNGEWAHDQFNGFGVWTSSGGWRFEGQFEPPWGSNWVFPDLSDFFRP